LVRTGLGVPDMPVVIENVAVWNSAADVADRFEDARIFLVGDAAHVMPPNGGFGGNTGIQDAHNLAWKLAMVMRGLAGPRLLATYEAERRPVARLTVEQAYSRYVTRSAPYLGTAGMEPLVDDLNIEVGYRYRSAAVIADAGDSRVNVHEAPRESRGNPGTRAPHMFVQHSGARISTIDLFGKHFVLLAGADGATWCDAARAAGRKLEIEVDAYCVGPDGDVVDAHNAFEDAYGITRAGAVLVRPDGFVGWRSSELGPAADVTLFQILSSILCRID
jgi:putative polyketide hydroxylase